MDNLKPGYTTTEFWVSIVSVAAILLKVLGVDISPEDQDALAASLATVIVGALAVWGIVTRYIKSRSEQKIAQLNANVTREAVRAGKPVTLSLGGK